MSKEKILVIKLSALGDFFQALGAMKAIRKHHQDADITLMTTKPFGELGRKTGYFDNIIIDERPKFYQISKWWKLKKILSQENFDRVYDLQNNDRTSIYFRLFSKKPEWVGVAKGASHRNISKERTKSNAFEGHKQTLALAGINNIDTDNLDWMVSDISKFNIPNNFAVLIPGSSPIHPEKRWPAEYYIELSKWLLDNDCVPVIIGGEAEKDVTSVISSSDNRIIDLTGKTDLFDIAELGRKAKYTIGNDTGPLHIISLTNCKTICLYCLKKSNPLKHTPLGKNTITMQDDDLANIDVKKIIDALSSI